MASIKREAIQKINSKLEGTGWKFDVGYFMCQGEKTLVKEIPIPNSEAVVEFQLMWYPDYETVKKPCGQSYRVNTGKNYPVIHFNKRLNGVSHGLGYWHRVGDAQDRMMFGKLEKIAPTFTDEFCCKLWEESKDKLNPYS